MFCKNFKQMTHKSLQLVILFSIGCLSVLFSQQDAQYTQYMYNTLSVNPAYAGSREAVSITGLHRSQWVGLEGAPRTQTFNIHSPVGVSQRVGLGLSIVNDALGPVDETYFDIDFSYTIPISYSGNLSFGLKGGGHLLSVNYNELRVFDINDELLGNNLDNKFYPNVGVGIYYRHADRWYAGISAPNLIESDHLKTTRDGESFFISEASERIHFYLMGGYVFDLNPDIKFKPAVLLKAVSGAPLQGDISANFLFSEKLTLGVGYRWSAAVSALAAFQLKDNIMIGLAYDKETTDLGNTSFNDGSYEVIIRFEIFRDNARAISPRFF